MQHWPSGYEILNSIKNELYWKIEIETNGQGLDDMMDYCVMLPVQNDNILTCTNTSEFTSATNVRMSMSGFKS